MVLERSWVAFGVEWFSEDWVVYRVGNFIELEGC